VLLGRSSLNDHHIFHPEDPNGIREILSSSGYSDVAIEYYLNRPNMGSLPDANQVTELTGPCGDTMRIYLKLDERQIQDAKIQVLGCPGAVASAMAAMDLIKGRTVEQAQELRDRDVFRVLKALPDQKQHCIRLAIKTLQKALDEYNGRKGPEGG
jgi:nitrogen fixation NifU-like protein